MRSIAALVLASCLAGCGAPSPSFAIGDGFSLEQRDELAGAASLWNNAGVAEPISLSGGEWSLELGELPVGWTGATDRDEHRITLRRGLPPALFGRAATHELGHALGLAHLNEHARGVMTWNIGDENRATDTLTPADVAECRRVSACP